MRRARNAKFWVSEDILPIRSPAITPDQFAIRLAELIGEAEDGDMTAEDLIHALENVVAAIRENEAE